MAAHQWIERCGLDPTTTRISAGKRLTFSSRWSLCIPMFLSSSLYHVYHTETKTPKVSLSNFCFRSSTMPSHKTLKIKKILAKKQKQNRPVPQWVSQSYRLATCSECHLLTRSVCEQEIPFATTPSVVISVAPNWDYKMKLVFTNKKEFNS